RWLTSEIYVDQGLEDALNIDRDSFNRFHPEYRAVQDFYHDLLQTKVFPKVYQQIDVRSEEKAEKRTKSRTAQLADVISEVKDVKVTITEEKGSRKTPVSESSLVNYDDSKIDI